MLLKIFWVGYFWKNIKTKKGTTMTTNHLILDFSHVYCDENIPKNIGIHWLDCSEIEECDLYCSRQAEEKIREKIKPYGIHGIHFLDSGNYHYMSRIGAGRVKEPFNLLVFDNHTDKQLPAFGGLLSCGGWIASALEEVEKLQEVWLIGPDEEAYGQVEEPFKDRVHFLSRERLAEARPYMAEKKGSEEELIRSLEIPANIPLYVSIDKDVLCPEEAATTWSQGDMTLEEMLKVLLALCSHFEKENGKILQVDICGECDPDKSMESPKNDHANKELLRFWKKWF